MTSGILAGATFFARWCSGTWYSPNVAFGRRRFFEGQVFWTVSLPDHPYLGWIALRQVENDISVDETFVDSVSRISLGRQKLKTSKSLFVSQN